MDILKNLFKVFHKVFSMLRERFFLIADSELPPPHPSSFQGEGMGEGELQQGNDQIQNQPRVHLSVEEKELIEKRTEDLAIPSFLENQHLSLCETLDRVLNTGVVIHGDITISVANIDLIYIGLKALLTSVETVRQAQSESSIQRFNRETYK